MMKHKTVVDTFAIQVNFTSEEECDATHSSLITRLEKYGYIDLDNDGYEIQYKYKTMATIEKASFSYKKKNKEIASKTWYLQIKIAGLKSFIEWKDIAMNNCLMIIMSCINTRKHFFKVIQFDVALDMFTKFEYILALCTNRIGSLKNYWKANDEQDYKTTRWIEKFQSQKQMNNASLRAQLYDKTKKHNLPFQVTRFEISFQKNFFKNNEFNAGSILHEFQRYHVNYIRDLKKQQMIKDQYDSKEVLRKKDVKELRLELSRLHIDVNVLFDFIVRVYQVNDDRLEQHLVGMDSKK